MRSQLTDAPGRTATVWGEVNADGSIRQGSGDFIVTKLGTGTYSIRFRRPFVTMPGLTFQSVDTQGFPYVASASSPGEARFTYSATSGGAGVDVRFLFIATGRLGV